MSPEISFEAGGKATLITVELDVLVPGFDVSLQVRYLGTGIVTGRTFVNNSFMDRLHVSFEVIRCCPFELAAFFRANQSETFMGDFDMFFELRLLLTGIITLITVVTQSLMLSFNVDIEFKLSLGRKVTIRTLECNIVMD